MRSLVVVLALTGISHAEDVDLHDWVKAQGASDESLQPWQSGKCELRTIGAHQEAAVVCFEVEQVIEPIAGKDEPAYRILHHYSIRAVRDHKIETLIDVPVRAGVMDAPVRPRGDKEPPWHPFTIADDGLSIVVGDPAEACHGLISKPKDKGWDKLDHSLHDRICNARGTWIWRNKKFERRR